MVLGLSLSDIWAHQAPMPSHRCIVTIEFHYMLSLRFPISRHLVVYGERVLLGFDRMHRHVAVHVAAACHPAATIAPAIRRSNRVCGIVQ
jgi:hypothetical protein